MLIQSSQAIMSQSHALQVVSNHVVLSSPSLKLQAASVQPTATATPSHMNVMAPFDSVHTMPSSTAIENPLESSHSPVGLASLDLTPALEIAGTMDLSLSRIEPTSYAPAATLEYHGGLLTSHYLPTVSSPQSTIWASSAATYFTPLVHVLESTPSLDSLALTISPNSQRELLSPPQEKSVPVLIEEASTTFLPSLANSEAKITPETSRSIAGGASNVKPSAVVGTSSILDDATPMASGKPRTTPPSTLPVSPGDRFNSTAVPDSSHSSEIIIGSALAVFLLAIIVLGTILCLRWKRRRPKAPDSRGQDDLWMDSFGPAYHMMPLPSLATCASEADVPKRKENIYTVAFPYQPHQEGQLSLDKGDKLQLVETAEGGWWRGVSLKRGNSGWFPSSYVTPADKASSENLANGLNDDDVTSENIGESKDNSAFDRQISSFQIKKIIPEKENPEEPKKYPAVELQQSHNDVESWVNMAASISMMSLPTTEMSYSTNATDFTTACKGQRFRAVYAYKPVNQGEMGLREGELITCQERDRNGWMLGRKTRSGEQGWFPAVYVDQVSSDDESICDPEIPETYDLLDSNKLHKVDQTFIGIDHTVIHPFSSPVPGDLALTLGETVSVLQTLANGWWFGVKDRDCGWFPGSFVKMIEDTSPPEVQSQLNHLNSKEVAALLLSGLGKAEDSRPHSGSQLSDLKGSTSSKEPASPKLTKALRTNMSTDSIDTAGSLHVQTDLRPHRKAPPPPSSVRNSAALSEAASDVQHGGTTRRPARRAPAPPSMQESKLKNNGTEDKHSERDGLTCKTGETRALSLQSNAPEKPVLLIGGKRPKLQKISCDRLDEKHLNPMIRPSTRGFMPKPSDSTQDIWQSRPEKRLLEKNKRRKNHSHRASSNLSNYNGSNSAYRWSEAGSEIGLVSTDQPSPISHYSHTSERLMQSPSGFTTPTGLSRSSSIGSSLNSHTTLSAPVPAINSVPVSDESKATLTNFSNENLEKDKKYYHLNEGSNNVSSFGRESPVLSRVAQLSRSRSRSQSPALFHTASSGLLQNVQRFKETSSQYSSDTSEAGASSVVSSPTSFQNSPSLLIPRPYSSMSQHHKRPKSQRNYNKKRDRRHRTLTSVIPPSVPKHDITNGSSPEHFVDNKDLMSPVKGNHEVKSSFSGNGVDNEDTSLLNQRHESLTSFRESNPTIRAEDNLADDTPCTNEVQYTDHSQTTSQCPQPSSATTSCSNQDLFIHQETSGPDTSPLTTDDEVFNVPHPEMRQQAPAGDDSTPARDSLAQLAPGTVSGIVQQINKLNPPFASLASHSSDMPNNISSNNFDREEGTGDIKEKNILGVHDDCKESNSVAGDVSTAFGDKTVEESENKETPDSVGKSYGVSNGTSGISPVSLDFQVSMQSSTDVDASEA